MSSEKPPRNVFRDVVIPILTIVITFITGFLAVRVQDLTRKTDTALKQQELERLERESDVTIKFKVYEAVKLSLESNDTRQQEVALALVSTVLPSGELQNSLLKVLAEAGQPIIKDQAFFVVEQRLRPSPGIFDIPPPPPPPPRPSVDDMKNWRFDIFWCEESGDYARDLAEKTWSYLRSRDYGQKGFPRVRMLPHSINSAAEYQVRGYEIRSNAGEEKLAQILKELVQDALDMNVDINIQHSDQYTPHYLSIFICI